MMDEREKTYLMSIIALDSKLKVADKSVAAEIAFIKEYVAEKGIDNGQIFDMVLKHIEKNDPNNKDVVRYAITELDLQDRDYLLTLLNIPSSGSQAEIEEFLNGVLSGENIQISDPETKFKFYNRIVMLAIQANNNVLIEKAIQKIQSL